MTEILLQVKKEESKLVITQADSIITINKKQAKTLQDVLTLFVSGRIR